MPRYRLVAPAIAAGFLVLSTLNSSAIGAEARGLAQAPYSKGYLSPDSVGALQKELIFQRAVQTYLWALPALNMYGMKEGSEAKFGKGYMSCRSSRSGSMPRL